MPDLVFHNIPLDSADAVESMVALGHKSLACSVQLMSNRGASVLEHVKNVGARQQISMLPVPRRRPLQIMLARMKSAVWAISFVVQPLAPLFARHAAAFAASDTRAAHVLPVALLFLAAQKRVMEGMAAGAVKG